MVEHWVASSNTVLGWVGSAASFVPELLTAAKPLAPGRI